MLNSDKNRKLSFLFLVLTVVCSLVIGNGVISTEVLGAQLSEEEESPASNTSPETPTTTINLDGPSDNLVPPDEVPKEETPKEDPPKDVIPSEAQNEEATPVKEETVPAISEEPPVSISEDPGISGGKEKLPAEQKGLLGEDEPSSGSEPSNDPAVKTRIESHSIPPTPEVEAKEPSKDSPSSTVVNSAQRPATQFRFAYKGLGGVFHLTEQVATAHYRTQGGRRYLALLRQSSAENPSQKFDLPVACEKYIYYIQEAGCGDPEIMAWAFSRQECSSQGFVAMKLTRSGWSLHTYCRRDALCDSGAPAGQVDRSKPSIQPVAAHPPAGNSSRRTACGPAISVLFPYCLGMSVSENQGERLNNGSPLSDEQFSPASNGLEWSDDTTHDEFGP